MQTQSSETRTCRKCGVEKPAADFSTHWRKRWCKRCNADVEMARNRRHGMPPAHRGEYNEFGQRRCTSCGDFKATDAFAKGNKRGRAIRSVYCKTCIAKRTSRYRAANPQLARAAVKVAWGRYGERYRLGRKDWTERNRDRVGMYTRRRRARIAGTASDGFSLADWNELKKLFDQRCAYCWERPGVLEQDHIRPLSRGGDHVLINIAPACRSCNARKHNKTLLEFLLTMQPALSRRL